MRGLYVLFRVCDIAEWDCRGVGAWARCASNGVRGGIRTHGLRIHTTSACAAVPAGNVRGLDCPFAVGRDP